MASALKNWWQKRFGYTLVEKDNGLYPSRMLWAKKTFGVVYVLTFIPYSIFNNYFRAHHPETLQIADLAFVAYALFLVFLVWLTPRIERRRFGPLGRPFVLIDQDTLALTLPDGSFHTQALSRLRALRIGPTVRKFPYDISQQVFFEQVDEYEWMDQTVEMRYNAATKAAVIDFLRRKLPASVHFTADEPAS